MSPAELRGAVAAAPEPDALRRVVQGCADLLRSHTEDDPFALVDVLQPLAKHPSDKVRRAMADACDAFPGELFDDAYELLIADVDHYVSAAARRAGQRRAERRRIAERNDAEDHLTAELASAIEARYGKAARKLAKRLARREVEQYLERMSHEATKLDDAITSALDTADAELAKPDPSSAALRRHAALLRERIVLQRALLVRARDYAKNIRPVFAPESVAAMVHDAKTQLEERLGPRAKELHFVADVPVGVAMHADRHAILQALQNVFQNAVEAYGKDAAERIVRVTGRALRKGTEIELCIADEGPGMSAAAKADLFIPFRSTKTGGFGIGLLMARKMIEEVHGGAFAIDSIEGEGTTVTLTLPARQAGVRDRL